MHMNCTCNCVLCSSLMLLLTQNLSLHFCFVFFPPFFDKMQIDSICVLLLLSEWVSREREVFLLSPFSPSVRSCASPTCLCL